MAKTKEQKTELMNRYKEVLADNPDYILVDTDRAGTEEITTLKKTLRESGAKFMVLKNTIFRIAAQEADQPTKVQEVTDSTGMVVVGDDPAAAAKALKEIQTEHEVMDTKFGVLFGELAEQDKIKAIADIPSREILLSKLVGSMQAPLSGFASVVTGNVREFVYALSEVQKSKDA